MRLQTYHSGIFLGLPQLVERFNKDERYRLATPLRVELGMDYGTNEPQAVIADPDALRVVSWLRRLADEIEDLVAGLPPHRIETDIEGEFLEVHP